MNDLSDFGVRGRLAYFIYSFLNFWVFNPRLSCLDMRFLSFLISHNEYLNRGMQIVMSF